MQGLLLPRGRILMLAAVLLYVYAPLIGLVLSSLQSARVGWSFGEGLSLKWYRAAFVDELYWEAGLNSIVVGCTVASLSLVLGSISAYHILRRSRRSLVYAAGISLPAFVPLILSGMALAFYFRQIGLMRESFLCIVLGQSSYVSPFAMILMYLGLVRQDPDIELAATNLGASRVTVFTKVVVPQAWEAVVATWLLAFALSWGEFIITWFVGGFLKTVPVLILGSLGSSLDPSLNALAVGSLVISFCCFAVVAVLVGRQTRKVSW